MSRTCSNIVLLRFTETRTAMANRLINSLGWNMPVPSALAAVYSDGDVVTRTYEVLLDSATETYEDFIVQPNGSGGGFAQGGAHHLPYPGEVSTTDTWLIDGDEYVFASGESGSYFFNANLRENRFTFTVGVEWHGKHEVKDVIFANEPAEFRHIAFEFHEDVDYSPGPSGRVSVTLDAFGDAMYVECVGIENLGGSVGPRYSGTMSNAVHAPMSWALKFKPTDEEGNVVALPVTVRFGVGPFGAYDLARTTPIDETVSFTAHGGPTAITLVRDRFGTNPSYPSPVGNEVVWDPYVASQNITGTRHWAPYYGNGMTMVQYILPDAMMGPLYEGLVEAESAPPPRPCMFPYHRYHDAAGATYQDLATLSLAAVRTYTLGTWGQSGSAPGASAVGGLLTAAAATATFGASSGSMNLLAPYRWMRVTIEAAANGSAVLIVRLPTSVDYEYPVSVQAGTHDYFLDLARPPNHYVEYVPKLPPTSFSSLRIRFASNVIRVTSCAAVVRTRAQLWVLGNGGDSRENYPPALYGHVDGVGTISATTTGGPGVSDSTNVREALDALELTTGIAIGTINDEPVAWVGPLEHGGYISAFDPDGERLGALDLVAGAQLRSTCYGRRVWAYANAGGHATEMFGGGAFPAIAEFIRGGVATASVVPSGLATLVAEWPAGLSPLPPGVWRYEFSPATDGWAKKATPQNPDENSAELYCLEMVQREMADGYSPTVSFTNIKGNRWFASLLAEAFSFASGRPSITARRDGTIFLARANSEEFVLSVAPPATPTTFGTTRTLAMGATHVALATGIDVHGPLWAGVIHTDDTVDLRATPDLGRSWPIVISLPPCDDLDICRAPDGTVYAFTLESGTIRARSFSPTGAVVAAAWDTSVTGLSTDARISVTSFPMGDSKFGIDLAVLDGSTSYVVSSVDGGKTFA